MGELQYRTIGQEFPQNKTKIYFASHPDDLDKYFSMISEDILSIKKNCAVFYAEKNDFKLTEERKWALRSMQLVVIPVTSNLLMTENEVVTSLLPFLKDHNLFILPIMMELYLEKDYEKVFGKTQYLNRAWIDPTEIPYQKKLESNLESILFDDGTMERIENSFRARLFLSYRKKDRKYIGEIMNLVHKQSKYTDVAVWYDEYLAVGKKYEKEIMDAFWKSDLFLIMVTKNLYKEENFAMDQEYQWAKSVNKPILPIQTEPFLSDRIQTVYEKIPGVINSGEVEKIEEKLEEYLPGKEQMEEKSPEKQYFIGLAYLNGILVEKNAKKAVDLITFAAENHIEGAIRRLVTIYTIGNGVKKSEEKAVLWQKQLVTFYEHKVAAGFCGKNLDLAWERLELGEGFYRLERYREAEAEFKKINDFCEKYGKTESSKTIQDLRYRCAYYLSRLELKKGNAEKAKEWIVHVLKAAELDYSFSDSEETARTLSVCYIQLGHIAQIQENFQQAEAYYEKAVDIEEKMLKKTNTLEARRGVMALYQHFGLIAEKEGNLKKSGQWYKKSLEFARQLLKDTKSEEDLYGLANLYSFVGRNYYYQDQMKLAEEYYQTGLKLLLKLEKTNQTLRYQKLKEHFYISLGDLYEAAGQTAKAQNFYEKRIFDEEKENKKEVNTEAERERLISYLKVGQLAIERCEFEKAENDLKKGMVLAKHLVKVKDTAGSRKDLAHAYSILGSLKLGKMECSQAISSYTHSYHIWKELYSKTNTQESRRNLYASMIHLGEAEQQNGNWDQAEKWYLEGLGLADAIEKKLENPTAKRDLSVVYMKLAVLKQVKKDISAADKWYEKGYEVVTELAEGSDNIQSLRELTAYCLQMGMIKLELGKFQQAEELYMKGYKSALKTEKQTHELIDRRNLSLACQHLGIFAIKRKNNYNQAREWFRRGVLFAENIYQEKKVPQIKNDLMTFYNNLELLEKNHGNTEMERYWSNKKKLL